jgi:hypothetical protein
MYIVLSHAKSHHHPYQSSSHFMLPPSPLLLHAVFWDCMTLLQMTVSYQTLDILQENGIAANDIQKLNNAGTYVRRFFTIESV